MTAGSEQSRVLTLVFTDLADSTALKTERGDAAVGDLIARHREHVTRLARESAGRIIDWAGDGCFLTFETPSSAVQFALALQQVHDRERDLPGVRIGLHMGEVTEKPGPDGDAGPPRVEGLAVDLAARISGLAQALQVLMSSAVFNSARQRLNSEDFGTPIAWRAHGLYELKGFDDAMEIAEAGIEGMSPLTPPPGSEKAHRAVTPAEEETLGWRPAVGLTIPKRDHWTLTSQLGEGGYGEVWLATHEKTKTNRVFKFCFEPERVRGLKREVVLFRLLKESLGDREDIAQILDWEFERAPYFLESEYTEGGDLKAWAKGQGGLANVPIETRLEIAAQAAVALGAAHGAGVLHKDIKPANILITETKTKGGVQASLTDFGIGLITDPGALLEKGITAAGLTQTLVSGSSTSGSGTRMYMAPEVIEGKPSSTRSDVYALGVVLYQLVVGDFAHTIAPGWERDIEDDLLREDIQACVEGKTDLRLSSADELAERIRTLDERRAQRAREQRASRRRKILTVSSIVGPILTLAVLGIAWQQNRLANEAREQKDIADQERIRSGVLTYQSQLGRIQDLIERNEMALATELLNDIPQERHNWEWGYLAAQSRSRLKYTLPQPNASPYSHAAFSPDGKHVIAGAWDGTATVWRLDTMEQVVTVKGPSERLLQVGFLPDGQRIFTALPLDGVRVWDLESGKQAYHLPNPKASLHFAAFYPDGSRIVTSAAGDTPRVWDAETGEHLLTLPGGLGYGTRNRLAPDHEIFNPDGGSMVTHANWFDDIEQIQGYVVDTNSGETITKLDEGSSWHTAFSPDGKRIVATFDSNTRIYDARTGEVLLELAEMAMGIDPETKYIMSITGDESKVRDFNTGEILRTIRGRTIDRLSGDFRTIAVPDTAAGGHRIINTLSGRLRGSFSESGIGLNRDGSRTLTWKPFDSSKPWPSIRMPDAQRLQPGIVTLWNTDSGESILSEAVAAVHFSWDGRFLFLARLDGSGVVYDVAEGTVTREFSDIGEGVRNGRLSRNGSRLLTVGKDRIVQVWSVETGQRMSTLEGHNTRLISVEFSPESGQIRTHYPDASSVLWDQETGLEHHTLDGFVSWGNNFSHDGSRIVTVDVGQTAVVWDTQTGEMIHELCCHMDSGAAHFAAFSPDDSLIVTGGYDSARVWNADTGEEVFSLPGTDDVNRQAFFSPDGASILVYQQPLDLVRMYDARTGSEKYTLDVLDSVNTEVIAFSPDSTRLVGSSMEEGAYTVWDVATGVERYSVSQADPILFARFNPDASEILSLTQRGDVRIWSATAEDDAELLTELSAELSEGDPPKDAEGRVLSPDGQRAVEHFDDGGVNIVDVETGILLLTIGMERGEVRFSNDGSVLYTTDGNQVKRIWKSTPWNAGRND